MLRYCASTRPPLAAASPPSVVRGTIAQRAPRNRRAVRRHRHRLETRPLRPVRRRVCSTLDLARIARPRRHSLQDRPNIGGYRRVVLALGSDRLQVVARRIAREVRRRVRALVNPTACAARFGPLPLLQCPRQSLRSTRMPRLSRPLPSRRHRRRPMTLRCRHYRRTPYPHKSTPRPQSTSLHPSTHLLSAVRMTFLDVNGHWVESWIPDDSAPCDGRSRATFGRAGDGRHTPVCTRRRL